MADSDSEVRRPVGQLPAAGAFILDQQTRDPHRGTPPWRDVCWLAGWQALKSKKSISLQSRCSETFSLTCLWFWPSLRTVGPHRCLVVALAKAGDHWRPIGVPTVLLLTALPCSPFSQHSAYSNQKIIRGTCEVVQPTWFCAKNPTIFSYWVSIQMLLLLSRFTGWTSRWQCHILLSTIKHILVLQIKT